MAHALETIVKGTLISNNLLVSHRQRICYHIHHHHLSEHRNTVNYSLIYHVHPYGAGARGSIRPRRETFSRTTAVLDSHFLVADIKMDGFNMRRADRSATIAFERTGSCKILKRGGRRLPKGGAAARATKGTCDDV